MLTYCHLYGTYFNKCIPAYISSCFSNDKVQQQMEAFKAVFSDAEKELQISMSEFSFQNYCGYEQKKK